MNRAVRSVPWLFAAGACAAPFVAFTGFFSSTAWPIVMAALGVVACVLGARQYGMPLPFVIAIAIGGARIATLETASEYDPLTASAMLDNLISVLVGIGLTLVLALALRSRRGRLDVRDLNDLTTVIVSSTIVAWIIATSQLIETDGFHPISAVSRTLYLPLAILLWAFIVDHLFTGLRHNRAMQLIVMAATCNLAGSLSSALRHTSTIDASRALDVGLLVAAFLFMCAGLAHRDAPATIAPRSTADEPAAYTPLRLAMNGACLFVPGLLIATIAPLTTTDAVVRGVAVCLGIGSVMTRLVMAVRSHDAARAELADRIDLDDLTRLPTRARFVPIVDDVLEDTWRSEFQPTIIQLNLDRFKDINDSLGHAQANEVLAQVGERLTAATARFGGIVARIGGDDFAIIDGTTRSTVDSMDRLSVVRNALAAPVTVDERTVFVTASFGVAIAPRRRTISADELLRRADIATHEAKSAGRNSVELFDDSMQSQLAHRMDVEHALHGAIGRQEMRLYHQPIVDIGTGRVTGFEALIRWQREGSIVSPGEFISIAEETGIIVEIGEWALREALRELKGWIADGVVDPETTISVNVSPRQIADPGFAEVVRTALEISGLPAELLWIEVTESMMLDEPELAESTLRRVREMGVRIALDDFGTGFSSLSMLQQFPIQRIKIDRAFVNGIAEPGHDRSLVRTVIAMAQSMGLDLVAEGVETVHQLEVLAELTCDKAQGFLISHPVPSDAMRSTMVALRELASLSLFGADAPDTTADLVDVADGEVAPVSPVANGRRVADHVTMAASRRPLGQPVL